MTTVLPDPAAPGANPAELLAALRAAAGGSVDGAEAGTLVGAPDISGLAPGRAEAVLAAWTGARLHAGQEGLLRTGDADLALLAGDWCFAYALQRLAHDGDLQAIGALASAIGACATLLAEAPAATGGLAAIWTATCESLRAA